MRHSCLTILFLASASLVFGQLDTDTITIQASRSTRLAPDQAFLSVSVNAGPDVSLDQIAAALAGSGIRASNLSSMYSSVGNLRWSLTLAVPFTKLKATIASLAVLQQSIATNKSGLSLDFGVQGIQVSSDAIQSQTCAAKDLVADAEVQAGKLAAAAGFAVGPIVAISDGSSFATATAVPGTFAARIGDFSVSAWFNTTAYSFSPPPGCSLEVKFQLLRYQ